MIKKLDRRTSVIIFGLTLIISLFVRMGQWKTAIDLHTGFFTGTGWAKTALGLIIIVGTVIFAIPVFFGKSTGKKGKINPFTADVDLLRKKTSIIFASVSLMISLFTFWDLFKTFTSTSHLSMFKIVLLVLQAASALVFLVTAISEYANKPFSSTNGYCYLIPTIWVALRAAQLFKNSTAITSNSQNLIKMLYLLSAILFFVYTARFYAGYEKKNTRKIILITAMLTAVLSFITVIPVYAYGKTATFVYNNALSESDLLIGVFAICMLAKFLGRDITPLADKIDADDETVSAIENIDEKNDETATEE